MISLLIHTLLSNYKHIQNNFYNFLVLLCYGATNIYKIAYIVINNNKERPNYLSRIKNLSTGLDKPVKTKIYTLCEEQTFLIFYFTERCG